MKYEYMEELDVDKHSITRCGRWSGILIDWMKTDKKVLKISLDDEHDKKVCRTALQAYMKAHDIDYTVYSERGKNNIYVVRP